MNLTKLSSLGVTQVGNYYETKNYKLFKPLLGNRDVKQAHVARLKESIAGNYLLTILVVNEKFEIIDGQHRFKAISELNFPVHFIIKNGYGLNEVQLLNTNGSIWTRRDYLGSFCELNLDPYLKMRKFMEDFPDFAIRPTLMIITGEFSNTRAITKNQKRVTVKDFQEGKLIIPNIAKSYQDARALLEIKPFFKKYFDPQFVSAMLQIFKNRHYEHKEFLKKLRAHPTALQVSKTVDQYKLDVEEIYNYNRKNKISLRY